MKKAESIETVYIYIYIYIVRFNEKNLNLNRKELCVLSVFNMYSSLPP